MALAPGSILGAFAMSKNRTYLTRNFMEVAAIDDNLIKIICPKCCRATIGVIREIDYTMRAGRYISCMHCGFKLEDPYKDSKQCMDHSSYVRNNGAIKQKR